MLVGLRSLPKEVFWSAPPDQDSDFSPEDPLALDYLGQQVGLWLFEGFTTRTSRAQYYAMVLYGLHLVEKAIRLYEYPDTDEKRIELFERWERFWALATLEHRKGKLDRGDDDSMRGVRGATRAWKPGTSSLPIDFNLVSRQSELGALGAYLSSLRHYGLVADKSLRVTPAAHMIIDAFWSEPGERQTSQRYEEYAVSALDLRSKSVARKRGGLTLAGLGKRSCLSSLRLGKRAKQQQRLWESLFFFARDGSTLALSEKSIAANRDQEKSPEALLKGFLSGRWGELSPENRGKVEIALRFGHVSQELLGRFDRAYASVKQNGWVVDFDTVSEDAFPEKESGRIRRVCSKLRSASQSARFGKLESHGRGFLSLMHKLDTSGPRDSLRHLLDFHGAVQQARRSSSWIREEGDKLALQVVSYNGHNTDPLFPSMKLNVVQRLLFDLGKLR